MEDHLDNKSPADVEAKASLSETTEYDQDVGVVYKAEPLARDLQGRHMQMIAIGMFSILNTSNNIH
jgi:amino acid permease